MSAVARAISLLKVFTAKRPELSLADLANATGLSKATALRLLASLIEGGLLSRSPATGLYRLGYDCLQLAEVAKAPSDLITQARPFMRAVRDSLQETVVLAVRSGDIRINIEQLEGLQPVRRVVAIGEPLPLYVSASSKVLLAAMSDEEIHAYLAHTPLKPWSSTTVTDPAKLWREIRAIRRNGFAEGVNEGASDGAAVSAPIRDRSGQTVGCFTVSVPISRFNKSLRARMIDEVKAAAAAISRGMGNTA